MEADLTDGRTGHLHPGGLTGPYVGLWQTLEDTGNALVQCRQHTAGGLELRHATCTPDAGWYVMLSGDAADALRILLAPEPTGELHDRHPEVTPRATRTPMVTRRPGLSILAAAEAHWQTVHGRPWTAAERTRCEAALTAAGWVHALPYDPHKRDLAREAELAFLFPPAEG